MSMTFQELEEAVVATRKDIAEIKELFKLMAKSDTVSREDILAEIGRSRTWLQGRDWVLPNYGKPDIPGTPERWYRSTWDAWKMDLETHERFWKNQMLRKVK